jgi:hypothetical protein
VLPQIAHRALLSSYQFKLLLYHLISHFDFAPIPEVEIGHIQVIALRPLVKGFASDGSQLPLLVKPISSS